MKKATTMLLLAACMTALFATAAYAETITGNDRNNTLLETREDDDIFGNGGADVLDANNFGGDADFLRGGTGNDRLLANDGDAEDTANGGLGSSDTCVVDDASEVGTGCERVRVEPPAPVDPPDEEPPVEEPPVDPPVDPPVEEPAA